MPARCREEERMQRICGPPPRVIMVIAGTIHQFRSFVREAKLHPHGCRNVRFHEDVLGYHADGIAAIVRVGEWWLNPMHDDPYVMQLEHRVAKRNQLAKRNHPRPRGGRRKERG